MPRTLGWIIWTIAAFSPAVSYSQQVTVTTPMIGVQDSFYEHFNLGWGFQRSWPGGNGFLNFGGPMSAIPPFGRYQPNGDFRFGLGTVGNGSRFGFNFSAGQGSSRTMTMTAPSVTMMNGARASVFDGSIRPFVTGLIPVVGDGSYPVVVPYAEYPQWSAGPGPFLVSPLAERMERLRAEGGRIASTASRSDAADLALDGDAGDADAAGVFSAGPTSSAERGDVSLAEIRREQAREDAARRGELDRLIAEAQAAEQAGHLALARILYKQAAARTDGAERQAIQQTIARLSSMPKSSSK